MAERKKTDLLALTPPQLRAALSEHFAARGQPTFRAGQTERWIYGGGARSVMEMTNLPLVERHALAERFELTEPELAHASRSTDGTAKHLWRLADDEVIESVLIPTERRLTLCLSSQVGCPLGCTFCATGWGGFGRQLSTGEIVGQFRASRRWAEANDYGPITNIVYMGMGEPLANRGAVHPSLTILNHGYGFGSRRITVSTVGVVPGILELAERPEQFRLALSLHAPSSDLRAKLIPLEKRYPLPEVLEALERFEEAGGKRITFEYTMIDGVNDDLALREPLADLALRVRAFVNLIPYNPIPYRDWCPSEPDRMEAFRALLQRRGVPVAVRETRGRDIDAACGQLRAHALAQIDSTRARGAAPSADQ